ncbi:hypothetical protein [Marinobacter sp. F3R11]|uniref:hypothetical protein n=1 Tax=Marinobacter sp. F3R11 TaxID=2267231 RepID=UPI000DE91FD0|nr:hypothetical protein [Marinobacter sp. F3R11]RBW49228.1 hypothetical protein DS878_14020 [Marinobacter sp. F3R11]
MKRLALALCMPLLAPGFVLAASQPHEAAPMIAPAQKPLTDEDLKNDRSAPQRAESAEVIITRFKAAFGNQPPRMAVFWNRAFDDQVSDWSSNTRGVVSTRGSLNGEVPDGNVNLQAQGQMAAQGEYRSNRSVGLAGAAFELQSGLVSQMIQAGVTVVDRAAIMRITDNTLETGDFSRLSPDQRRLEMRALGEHADMLLVFRKLAHDKFEVEVLDIRDGQIRAMLSSNGVPPEKDKTRQWKATDHGFQKVEQTVTLDEIGQELALQTLAKLGR